MEKQEQEFDPYPKLPTDTVLSEMRDLLANSCVTNRGHFHSDGQFEVIDSTGQKISLWASNLLRYNPIDHFIRIIQGGMMRVERRQGPCVFVIDPANVRCVARKRSLLVTELGYFVAGILRTAPLEPIIRVPDDYFFEPLSIIEFQTPDPQEYDAVVLEWGINERYLLCPRIIEYNQGP